MSSASANGWLQRDSGEPRRGCPLAAGRGNTAVAPSAPDRLPERVSDRRWPRRAVRAETWRRGCTRARTKGTASGNRSAAPRARRRRRARHERRRERNGVWDCGRANAERIGAPDRSRTCDLWLRKPTLYPTELRAHGERFYASMRNDVQPRSRQPRASVVASHACACNGPRRPAYCGRPARYNPRSRTGVQAPGKRQQFDGRP